VARTAIGDRGANKGELQMAEVAQKMGETSSFAYEAQTAQGDTVSGTIDAPAVDQAARRLQLLQLRVTRMAPTQRALKPATFGADDFLAFNRQLAQLTARGMPIERTLRLMAREMRKPRQRRAVETIATELEKGTTLAAAFDTQRGAFPPLYGKLLDAGVRSNNLSAMLMSLGRHVEMVQRLRAALWRAASYPLMVLVALLVVLSFIWFYIMPHFAPLLGGPNLAGQLFWSPWGRPPTVSGGPLEWVVPIAGYLSFTVMIFIAAVLLGVLVLSIGARLWWTRTLVERIALREPLVGPILRWNLLARWCDALHLGTQAALDLPASLALAADAVGSDALRHDSDQLARAVTSGGAMDDESGEPLALLPPLIPAALQLGVEQNDLPAAAATLAKMYQDQVEARVAVLPQVLAPILLIVTAVCIGLAIASTLLPLMAVFRALMR
jgi:type II secretory pathway component PulF